MSEELREEMMNVARRTLKGGLPLPTADRMNETFKQVNNNLNHDCNRYRAGMVNRLGDQVDGVLKNLDEAEKIRVKPKELLTKKKK